MGHAVSFFCLFFSAAGGRVALSLGLAGAWDRDVSRCTLRAVPGLASSGTVRSGATSGDRAFGVDLRGGDGSCTAGVPRGFLAMLCDAKVASTALAPGVASRRDRWCGGAFSDGDACGRK